MFAACRHTCSSPAGIFDVNSTSIRRQYFDVEIFLRFQPFFNVETSTSTSNRRLYFDGFLFGVEKALKNQRRNIDVDSTSKFRLARWVSSSTTVFNRNFWQCTIISPKGWLWGLDIRRAYCSKWRGCRWFMAIQRQYLVWLPSWQHRCIYMWETFK